MTTGLLAPSHLVLLALVALLVFGPKRLPEIGRSLGHGLRGFKESVSGDKPEADADSVSVAAESRALPPPSRAQLEQPAAQPLVARNAKSNRSRSRWGSPSASGTTRRWSSSSISASSGAAS